MTTAEDGAFIEDQIDGLADDIADLICCSVALVPEHLRVYFATRLNEVLAAKAIEKSRG